MFDLPLLRQQDILEDYRKRQYQTTASRRQLLVWRRRRRRSGAHLAIAVASSWSKEVGSSHDFPHQWFAIDSLNHRRSNIILFGKMKLIALQNSILNHIQTRSNLRDDWEHEKSIRLHKNNRPKVLSSYQITFGFLLTSYFSSIFSTSNLFNLFFQLLNANYHNIFPADNCQSPVLKKESRIGGRWWKVDLLETFQIIQVNVSFLANIKLLPSWVTK